MLHAPGFSPFARILRVTTNKYAAKDVEKFSSFKCNKLIARGSVNSSSEKYRKLFPEFSNTGVYQSTDIVAVSAEGNRRNRIAFDQEELLKAINAGAAIVTDNKSNRSRPHNLGERVVAQFLINHDYIPKNTREGAIWKPQT